MKVYKLDHDSFPSPQVPFNEDVFNKHSRNETISSKINSILVDKI